MVDILKEYDKIAYYTKMGIDLDIIPEGETPKNGK
jgi:hypothetical protein